MLIWVCMDAQWDDFRYFLAVAREGRLLRAARVLSVEHTTVARRIAALEETLGVSLFYRTAKGHLLTREGTRIRAHAEEIERSVLGLATTVREVAGRIEGRVRIAMIESLAAHWFVPRLAQLRARHPRLEIELVAGNPQSDLSRGHADLAVRTPRPERRELTAVKIARGPFGLYGLPELISRRYKLDEDPPRARGIPLAIYGDDFQFLQRAPWFDRVLEQADVRLRTNSTPALVAAARSGLAISVLPWFAAAGFTEACRRKNTFQEAWLVSHPEFRRDPRVRAVSQFIREIAAELAVHD